MCSGTSLNQYLDGHTDDPWISNTEVSLEQEVPESKELQKYWFQRYRLFSKFDQGIKLDHGSKTQIFFQTKQK